jgi:hypothetical protein
VLHPLHLERCIIGAPFRHWQAATETAAVPPTVIHIKPLVSPGQFHQLALGARLSKNPWRLSFTTWEASGQRSSTMRLSSPGAFDLCVEPFVGGGATYFHLNHPGANVVADSKPLVINYLPAGAGRLGTPAGLSGEEVPQYQGQLPLYSQRSRHQRAAAARGVLVLLLLPRYQPTRLVGPLQHRMEPQHAAIIRGHHGQALRPPEAFLFHGPPYLAFDHYPGA